MSSGVTQWIALLKSGDVRAAQPLWEHYFDLLMNKARTQLRLASRRVLDEEDVVVCALNSFFQGAMAGRYPQLTDSTDLWRLLVAITAHKAAHQRDALECARRGGGEVRGESAWLAEEDAKRGIEEVIGDEPDPEFVAEVAEELRQRIDSLRDKTLRSIARWKLEGYTNEEIKDKLGCSLAKVERKLVRIRHFWNQRDSGGSNGEKNSQKK